MWEENRRHCCQKPVKKIEKKKKSPQINNTSIYCTFLPRQPLLTPMNLWLVCWEHSTLESEVSIVLGMLTVSEMANRGEIEYVMPGCVNHTVRGITEHVHGGWLACNVAHSTRVKLLGEAAHLLTVVRGHSCTTSFVFSSTRITDSLVIPSSRGTSLFLPFIFSCQRRQTSERVYAAAKHLRRWFIEGAKATLLCHSAGRGYAAHAVSVA